MASKRLLGGGAFIVASALLFGKETLLWAWNRLLDFFTGGGGGVTIANLPWQNIFASMFAVTGLAILFWPRKKVAKVDPYARLAERARGIVQRIRRQRQNPFLPSIGGEPLTDVCRDGSSLLMLFAQQGIHTPRFNTDEAERVAIGMEAYFSAMFTLLRDRHIDLAIAQSPAISDRAENEAATFNYEDWNP